MCLQIPVVLDFHYDIVLKIKSENFPAVDVTSLLLFNINYSEETANSR